MSVNKCENCEASLTGPYCAACGQHAHASARSLPSLLHDALHDLTHIEGKFWPTLKLLLVRPGQLTREYFVGRRTRYAPPFRLYLVLSVLFFALSSLIDRVDPDRSQGGYHAVHVETESSAKSCDELQVSSPAVERFARRVCQKIVIDNGRSVTHTFETLIPKSMFVFLPMIAGVLAVLYRRPRRFYVEHLVLVLHNHAAAFTAMSIAQGIHLLAIGAAAIGIPALRLGLEDLRHLLDFFLLAYVPWYTYRSLRNYYELPRRSTWLRLLPLGFAYLCCLGLTFGLTFLLSATLT